MRTKIAEDEDTRTEIVEGKGTDAEESRFQTKNKYKGGVMLVNLRNLDREQAKMRMKEEQVLGKSFRDRRNTVYKGRSFA